MQRNASEIPYAKKHSQLIPLPYSPCTICRAIGDLEAPATTPADADLDAPHTEEADNGPEAPTTKRKRL